MIVEIATAAEADLEEIGDWIAQDAPRRARTYVAELRSACESLAENPERFARVDAERAEALRRRIYGRHLIYYVVEGALVRVLRIVDGSREPTRLLGL